MIYQIKITQEQLDLLETGNTFKDSKGNTYYHLPFIFIKTDDATRDFFVISINGLTKEKYNLIRTALDNLKHLIARKW